MDKGLGFDVLDSERVGLVMKSSQTVTMDERRDH